MRMNEESITLRVAILSTSAFLLGMVLMGMVNYSPLVEANSTSSTSNTPTHSIDYIHEHCSIPEPEVEYVLNTEYIYVEPEFNYSTKNEPFAGYYYHSSGIVEIYPERMDSFEAYMQIAAHEYGHYYYFEELTSGDRNKICKEFRQTDEFVSEYASTSCEEYYAVTYWEVEYEV